MATSESVITIKEYLIRWSQSLSSNTFPHSIIYYYDIDNKTIFRYSKLDDSLKDSKDEVRYRDLGKSGQKINQGLDELITYMLTYKGYTIIYRNYKCAVFSKLTPLYFLWKEFFDDITKCCDFNENLYKDRYNNLDKIVMEASYIYSTKIRIIDKTARSNITYFKGQKINDPDSTYFLIYADLNVFVYMNSGSDIYNLIINYIKFYHISILEAEINIDDDPISIVMKKRLGEYDADMYYVAHC